MKSEKKLTNETRVSRILSLLGVCAIFASTATKALEQSCFDRGFAPVSEQPSLSEKKTNNQSAKNAAAVLEELDLEKEWEGILGDKSELEFLAFAISTY